MYRLTTTCGRTEGGLVIADGPYRIASTAAFERQQVRVLRPLVLSPRRFSVGEPPQHVGQFEIDLSQVQQ
jgi:hypothetical protein